MTIRADGMKGLLLCRNNISVETQKTKARELESLMTTRAKHKGVKVGSTSSWRKGHNWDISRGSSRSKSVRQCRNAQSMLKNLPFLKGAGEPGLDLGR